MFGRKNGNGHEREKATISEIHRDVRVGGTYGVAIHFANGHGSNGSNGTGRHNGAYNGTLLYPTNLLTNAFQHLKPGDEVTISSHAGFVTSIYDTQGRPLVRQKQLMGER